MATLLDLGLLDHFGSIFVFLLIFLVTYAFLQVSGLFKKAEGHRGIYALISLAIAFLVSVSSQAVAVISVMTPWFTVLIIFMFLIFFVVRMFSGEDDELFKKLIKQNAIYWVLIVIFVIILLVSLSSIFGQKLLEDQIGPQNNTEITTTPQGEFGVDYSGYDYEPGEAGSTATTDYGNNFLMTLVHPKVLGMLLLVLIGFFAILLLSGTPEPKK